MSARRAMKEKLARYLRNAAKEGKGCSGNNKALGALLGMTTEQVSIARGDLVLSGRLKRDGYQAVYASIDGIKFTSLYNLPEPSKAEPIITVLRRYFPMVVDARVIDEPKVAIAGQVPETIIVGDRRISMGMAFALAMSVST